MSTIECAYEIGAASDLYARVLVARMKGVHATADDARLLEAHVAFGVTLFAPDALVLDMAALAVAGGGAVRHAIRPVEPNLEEGYPLYVVVSPFNRATVMAVLPEKACVGSVDEALARIRDAGPWAVR